MQRRVLNAKQFYSVEEDTRLARRVYSVLHYTLQALAFAKIYCRKATARQRAAALSGYLQNNMNMYLSGLILSPGVKLSNPAV